MEREEIDMRREKEKIYEGEGRDRYEERKRGKILRRGREEIDMRKKKRRDMRGRGEKIYDWRGKRWI